MSYIGAQPTTSAFVTDQFSANGSGTVFTLSVAPANTSSILVAVSGVLQDPSTYSVSGTTLTFSAAPPAGTGNISVRFLGIPASGVTTTAYRTVTEFTATAGQTTFTPPSYTVGYINVYRNGALLGTADYTATNGTTVVLASAASSGDLVVVESFYVSSVLNAIPATNGAVTSAYLLDGSVTTAKIADANVTPAKLSQPFTSGTAVASTSGTAVDFTNIPSWVKRITVMFTGVSTSGTSAKLIQLGDSGGIEDTGYLGTGGSYTGTAGVTAYTAGFGIRSVLAADVINGVVQICLLTGTTWAAFGNLSRSDGAQMFNVAGSKALSDTLTQIRITTANGTDTFDAGTINILYE